MTLLPLAAFLAVFLAVPGSSAFEHDSGSRLGLLRLHNLEAAEQGLVLLFSQGRGWSEADARDAESIAAAGYAVAGVDSGGALAQAQAQEAGDCIYLVSDIEALAKSLAREAGTRRYPAPILAGRGLGGLLAEVALAQAPAATLEGAVSESPAESLPGPLAFCPGADARPAGAGFSYRIGEPLPGWLSRLPAGSRAELAGEIAAARAAHAATATLDDLPLVEIPAAGRPWALAVVFSGDGGWRDIDKQIAGVLAQRGVATVGWDSLRHFWRRQEPARVAGDLSRVLAHYRAAWQVERVLLVGFSFGADLLPAVVAALPPGERAAIDQVSLLALGREAHFEIQVAGWLGLEREGGRPIAPDLAALEPARLQCFMGRQEPDSLCRDAFFDRAERVVTEGGHHFDGDYRRLAELILAGAARRGGGS